MKIKILLVGVLVFAFASCGQKPKPQQQQTDNQVVAVESVVEIDTVGNSSYYKFVQDKNNKEDVGTIYIKNVTFSEHLSEEVIFKETQTIKKYADLESQESTIDIDIIDLKTSKIKRSFSVFADKIEFDGFFNFYLAKKYGCCGSPNTFEMGELWKDNVFLRCENNIFEIKLSNLQFYFGFINIYNDKTGKIGELTFVHKNRDKYSYQIANKLIFKVKNEELRKKYYDLSTEINFLAYDINSKLEEYYPYKILSLWNLKYDSFSEVYLDVIRIEFSFEDEPTTIAIPIQNGYLFGNKSKKQIIYLDDYVLNKY